jgi:DNA polymerase-3 subunit delta'
MAWGRVKGHDAIAEGLRRVVARGRLGHAYLFVGPPGVGKRLFATELARALLCERPLEALTACGECPSCVQLEAGAHPDFAFAECPPDKNRFPLAELRKILDLFPLKPARGKGKVYVIDASAELTEEAANAFLKSLEEPPPGSVVLLLAPGVERQLPTIISRCQVIRFGPLPDEVVREVLAQEGVTDEKLAARAVRLAEGSAGKALALTDAGLWSFRAELLTGLMARPIATPELGKAWLAFNEGAGKELAAQRRRSSLLIGLLADVFADALRVREGASARRTGPEDARIVESLASRFDADELAEALERILEADAQVGRFVQLVLVQDALLDWLAQKLLN